MAKRSVSERDSERVEVVATTVRLRLRKSVHLKIQGKVSGKWYEFPGAGSEVDVDEVDVPTMLAKMPSTSCCTGTPVQPYFEKV